MRYWVLMTGLLVSSIVWAQNTQHIATTEQDSQHIASRYQASDWGVSKADWQRYQTLMQNPLTYDMQDANPIEVLAQFARSANERKRLAQMLVEFDKQRTDGLLALDAAYRQAWLNLYPNLKPIKAGLPERVVLFVTQNCETCIDALKAWRSQGVKVDVYMVDSRGDDTLLRQWATSAGIRQSDVNAQFITLNHDTRGLWFNLAKGKPAPVAVAKEGDQWSVITLP